MSTVADVGGTETTTSTSLRATFAAEWLKLASLRGNWITVILGVVLGIAFTALVAAGTASGYDQRDSSVDLSTLPYVGLWITSVFFVVLGVRIVTAEHSSGMIRLTYTITPKRERVLLAKLAIVTLVTIVVGAVATLTMWSMTQLIFDAADITLAERSGADPVVTMLALILTLPAFPLIGAALGFVLRNTAGAITAIFALLFLPDVVLSALPDWWQRNVLRFLPGSASNDVAFPSEEGFSGTEGLGRWAAILTLVAWVVLFCAAAWYVIDHHDA